MEQKMTEQVQAVPLLPAPMPDSLPPAMPTHLLQGDLLKLAREVAMDIRPLPIVLVDYKLTEAQYNMLLTTRYYPGVLELAQREWNSALTTPERVRISSAALLEQALPVIGARAGDKREDLNKTVEAAKLLAKVSQLDQAVGPVGGGEKFSITINIGEQTLAFEKNITPDKVIEGSAISAIEGPKAD